MEKKELKINEVISEPEQNKFSNLFFRTDENPLPKRVFRFLEMSGDTTGDNMRTKKYINWRPAKICYGKKKWFVYYQYKIPEQFKKLFPGKDWKRFKVYEDINIIKTRDYAILLRDAVNTQLEKGFDPFSLAKSKHDFKTVKNWTINQALNYFKTRSLDRGLELRTIRKYKYESNSFSRWLLKKNYSEYSITDISSQMIESYLNEKSKDKEWSNRTFNNSLTILRTIFNFFMKKKMIADNPMIEIEKRRSKSTKHKYYDGDKFRSILDLMQKKDATLYLAARLVYYLCIRSEKELKYFKTGNIFLETRKVLITADDSKTDRDRYIPIADHIFEELKTIKESYPDNYFVIGVAHKNKFVNENNPSPEPFGNGFLSKRFAKIRKAAGLSSDHTIYGFKHTRIIHLKLDGATDPEIMRLTGHTSFESYAKYLRDLDVDVDSENVNRLSRKI